MAATLAARYPAGMGVRAGREAEIAKVLQELETPLNTLAADTCSMLARLGEREREDARNLQRIDRAMAFLERVVEAQLGDLRCDGTPVRAIELRQVVEAAIAACPERDRVVLEATEPSMVVVDPRRAQLACEALLHEVGGCESPAEIRVRIRPPASVELFGGTQIDTAGFAVSLARRIARAHGGDVSASTAGGAEGIALVLPPLPSRSRQSASILLLDDNVDHANVLAELLRLQGFTIEVTTTARDALFCLAVRAPDLMVLDVRLAGITGDNVVRWARQTYPGLPAIVLTGYPRDHAQVRAILAEPASEYLAKPANLDVILALVTKMLRTG